MRCDTLRHSASLGIKPACRSVDWWLGSSCRSRVLGPSLTIPVPQLTRGGRIRVPARRDLRSVHCRTVTAVRVDDGLSLFTAGARSCDREATCPWQIQPVSIAPSTPGHLMLLRIERDSRAEVTGDPRRRRIQGGVTPAPGSDASGPSPRDACGEYFTRSLDQSCQYGVNRTLSLLCAILGLPPWARRLEGSLIAVEGAGGEPGHRAGQGGE